jgi:hypothetical protein
MREALEHPLLGLLVPDKWGDYVTLRKFPFLPEFARSNREPDEEDAVLVHDWQRHIASLASRAREFGLRGGLHRLGVFEVYVVGSGNGGRPSAAQVAAFEAFVTDEEQVCRNLVDAMLRYYGSARRNIPNCFVDLPSDGGEFPDDPDPTALAGVLEFDCLTIPHTAVAGVSPLIFSWGPAWDEEHGLRSLVYNGQVLMTGTDDVSDMESWPSDKRFNLVWNRSVMTPAEIAAYDAYRRGHEGAGGE